MQVVLVRLVALSIVGALAACGGGATPTHPTTTAAARTAAPTSMADELCACADEACAEPIMTRLFQRQLESTDSTRAHDAEYDRAVACERARRRDDKSADVVMAVVPAIVDETCACTDAACVQSADDRLVRLLESVGSRAVLDSKQVARLSESLTRFATCARRLAAPSPVVTLALQSADEVCACADLACAEAAAERGNQAIAPYRERHLQLSHADAASYQVEVHRAAICMDALNRPDAK